MMLHSVNNMLAHPPSLETIFPINNGDPLRNLQGCKSTTNTSAQMFVSQLKQYNPSCKLNTYAPAKPSSGAKCLSLSCCVLDDEPGRMS